MKYCSFFFLFLGSCALPADELAEYSELIINDLDFQGKVIYQKLTKSEGFRLTLIDKDNLRLDQTIFHYRAYHLDTADVNHDGRTEILVGLIKSTEFDPIEKKRLFILRIDETQLRPLWLGSKVCQELLDFKTTKNGIIQTLEKTKKGNYAIGQYRWQSFGLVLINYLYHEIPLDEASNYFKL